MCVEQGGKALRKVKNIQNRDKHLLRRLQMTEHRHVCWKRLRRRHSGLAQDLDYVEKLSFAVCYKPDHAILFQRKPLKEVKDKGCENCNYTCDEETL
jgi:hypothetical protein